MFVLKVLLRVDLILVAPSFLSRTINSTLLLKFFLFHFLKKRRERERVNWILLLLVVVDVCSISNVQRSEKRRSTWSVRKTFSSLSCSMADLSPPWCLCSVVFFVFVADWCGVAWRKEWEIGLSLSFSSIEGGMREWSDLFKWFLVS